MLTAILETPAIRAMRDVAIQLGVSQKVRSVLECQRRHTGPCDLCVHRLEEVLVLLGVQPALVKQIGLEQLQPGEVDPRD